MSQIALQYTILSGDSFSKIASELASCKGVTEAQITNVNSGLQVGQLKEGDLLQIPAAGTNSIALKYTVLPNDTLSGIVTNINKAAGVATNQISTANPGVVPTKLQIGELINIPACDTSEPKASEEPKAAIIQSDIVGYWDWTWDHTPALPDANIGIAFSGWTDVATAIQQSERLLSSLVGSPFICLGGGNENGAFTAERLSVITEAIASEKFEGYCGIAFDVEEGDSNLESAFAAAFHAAQKSGYEVLVTVSHSAPFGITDGAALMQSFFSNKDIDIISPQLYTTGKETKNDYATSHGVTWNEYTQAQSMIVPSIVEASMYNDAVTYFKEQGVALSGYIQWSRSPGLVA